MMDFGEAIRALKLGAAVARKGWNGKNMRLYLEPGQRPARTHKRPSIAVDGKIEGVPEELFGDTVPCGATVLPSIAMRTASGAILHGWLASQTDILAEDWEITTNA